MNKAILMGRLTRDPELRQTPTGVSVTSFTIAVNRRFAKEGGQEADFINCVAWRQTAEFVCRYFQKGSMIAVCGSIQTRSWDGQDGKKQYATEVVAEEVHFTGSKSESSTRGGAGGYPQNNNWGAPPPVQAGNSAPVSNQNQNQNQGGSSDFGDDFDSLGFSGIDGSEDDLPF